MQNVNTTKGDPLSERTDDQVRQSLEKADVPEYAQKWILATVGYAREHKLSLKKLADRTGVPHGTLSQIINGNYPGDFTERARVLEKFFVDLGKKAIFGGCREFVETEISQGIWRICEKTRYNRRIQIIQSEEQLGKTTALKEYARRNNGGRTIYVQLQPGGTSNPFGVFLRDLAMAVGFRDIKSQKITDIRFAIRERLAICDEVIIDEFHQIEHWPDKVVRDLLDYLRTELHADGERGIVLIATNSDAMTLLNSFRHRANYNLGQLLGRMRVQVLEILADEIPVRDVQLLVERYYKPGKAVLKKLYDLATRKKLGHFGLIQDIMTDAWADAKLDKRELTDEDVMRKAEEATEELQRQEGVRK